jgi:small ligand-binding sensory domain FIST
MKCASALSTTRSTEFALNDVIDRTVSTLGGQPADLAVVFASAHHAGAFDRLASELARRRVARHVLGCTGESIVGEDREVEDEPALALWTITLPGIDVRPVRLTFDEEGVSGWSEGALDPERRSVLLLGDPFSFPTDEFLKALHAESPRLRVMGGMASAGRSPGENRLILDGEVFDDGAVAVVLDGPLKLRSVVSQGCRPIGRSMIVTRAERNIIRELGRRPVLEVLREVFDSLSAEDQDRARNGLHLGRVINEYQERFDRGDFLVRNVLGTDDAGGLAITDVVKVGQTVQFHIRDSETADEDLRGLLANEQSAREDGRVAGALLFSCNGRGTRLFPEPNHDVGVIHAQLGPVPVAGFFAMGELGPVGGQNFVHGYTASIVLFEASGTPQ